MIYFFANVLRLLTGRTVPMRIPNQPVLSVAWFSKIEMSILLLFNGSKTPDLICAIPANVSLPDDLRIEAPPIEILV